MRLYKLLLADDEEEIREGMIRKLDWEALGFEIAASAENGVEALERMDQVEPDVIMTDIKMPFMDGLEFLEKAVERLPAAKIVVFSGFDDFEYAQRAIKLGVEEYILKPVSAGQLEESLRKLKKKMDDELDRKRNIDMLRKSYEESLPLFREQYFNNLITGSMNPEEIAKKAAAYGFQCISSNYKTIAVLKAEQPPLTSQSQQSLLAGREELIPISIRNTAAVMLEKNYRIDSMIYSDMVVIMAGMEWENKVSLLQHMLNEICKEIKKVLGIHVTAGIGGIYTSMEDMDKSYGQAQNALEYSTLFWKEGEYTVFIHDIEPRDTSVSLQLGENRERELLNGIKMANLNLVENILVSFFENLKLAKLSFSECQTHILEMYVMLMKLVQSSQLDKTEIFGEDTNGLYTVLELHSLDQIQAWFIHICKTISSKIQKGRSDSGKSLADRARQYIEEHYADAELSLEFLCEKFHVSQAYFSTMFKRETGTNFVAFLTELRLERATYLLDTTDNKTYIIAAQVGYTEPNYFSYVFKKKFGMSPSRYRKRLETKEN